MCCKCVCCCKNIENEIEEKHPDDIVIKLILLKMLNNINECIFQHEQMNQ